MLEKKVEKRTRQAGGKRSNSSSKIMPEAVADSNVLSTLHTPKKEKWSDPLAPPAKQKFARDQAQALKVEFCRLMKQSKWSRAEIAQQLRISPSHVSHLLSGDKLPSETLVELARIKTTLPSDSERLFPKALQGSLEVRKTKLVSQLRQMIVAVLSLDPERQLKAIKHIQGLIGAMR